MAAVVGSITNVDATLNSFIVEGTITVSGSYPGSGNGDTLSFAGFDQIKSSSPPRFVEIKEQPAAGTAVSGLLYDFAPGTTMANGKMIVSVPRGAFTPAGTNSAPNLTIGAGTPATYPVGTAANTGTTTLVATGAVTVPGVAAPTFTGTAVAAGAATQLGNVSYASVNAANIVFRAVFTKFM